MTYTLASPGPMGAAPSSVIRDADGASIPFDENNRDYKEYLEWKAKGNTPTPAPAPRPPTAAELARAAAIASARAKIIKLGFTAAEADAILGNLGLT